MNEAIQNLADPDEDELLKDVLDAVHDLEPDSSLDLTFLFKQSNYAIGHVLESVPPGIRQDIWALLPSDRYWPVLLTLQQDTARNLIKALDYPTQLQLQQLATAPDLIELADALPDQMIDAILRDQDEDIVEDLQEALSYDDDLVGRFINKNILRVKPSLPTASIVKRLAKRADDPPVAIFVVDDEGFLQGHIPINQTLYTTELQSAAELCLPLVAFDHEDSIMEAANDDGVDESSIWYPVLRNNKVIGAVSVWTMLYELQEVAMDASSNESPGSEEDLFTPMSIAARARGFWLSINLLTAFLASWVIGWFEATLQQVVALAILMPVVASMGGIAGSQTLAVALRGLALNHLTDANFRLVLLKEIKIAVITGLALGTLIAMVVTYWFDSFKLGLIILIAVGLNSLAAAASGTLIPFVLNKINIDPAVSGAVILTTITDVVGFFVFLSLASLIF